MTSRNLAAEHEPSLLSILMLEVLLIIGMIVVYQLPQLDFIANWQNPEDTGVVKTFQFISDSINYFSMGIPLLLALSYEWRKQDVKKSRVALLYLLLSIGIAGLISYLIKKSFLEPRPYEIDSRITQLSVGGGYSFPSGHTTEAFASATALFLLFFQRKWVGFIAFSWALSVAASRVYLGVHYPFDVLAGMIIGSSVAYTFYHFIFIRWLVHRKN
jgi:undecaprenyl-diphosphatase